jgi:tetratricopeptide (TPR) repeat protein
MLGIVFGQEVQQSVRDVRNALAVFQKLGDAEWEVASLEALGVYSRYSGMYADAEKLLVRALSQAKQRNLEDKVGTVTLALARLSFERSDYMSARRELTRVVDAAGRVGVSALTLRSRVHLRLGDLAQADRDLSEAERRLEQRSDAAVRPQVDAARGELALERRDVRQARDYFAKVALESPSVEETVIRSRVNLAFLDALDGRRTEAVRALEQCATEARQMGHVALEAFALVQLGHVHLLRRMPTEAVRVLGPVMDGAVELGTELRAQVGYWTGRALVEAGDSGGIEHIRAARQLVEGLLLQLPEEHREGFAAREDIRVLRE